MRTAIVLDSLFENVNVVQQSLHGLTARQRAIGENVANADTPGYKRLEVTYERQLRASLKGKQEAKDDLVLKTNSSRHFQLGPLSSNDATLMHRVDDETYRTDQNNVDIEVEMTKLAETNIRYNTMATLARDKFEGIKGILREIR
jgi:flagellar basal-body rod protein FlgB